MDRKIRWGIIGTGQIARKFAEGLKSADGAELAAIGSRTQDKADAFGDAFGVARRYDSYEALVGDDGVDAVYVATPHPMHRDNAILAMEAGKAVLCEKPFTVNAAEALEVIGVARSRGVFCMEAMWTRFLPAMVEARRLISDGAIGRPRMILADFGFSGHFAPEHRLFNPDLAGGALLDVGVYCVSLASMLFGTPTRVASLADIGDTGVDEQAGMVLGFEDSRLAVLATGVRATTPQEASILGTEGRLRLNQPWFCASRITLQRDGKEPEEIDAPMVGNGFNYEAQEVARCLREGRLESDVMPLDESITIMETMDRIRSQWGLKYPFE